MTPLPPAAASPLAIDREPDAGNTYLEKLVKLIPVEVTAFYTALVAMGSGNPQLKLYLGVLLILLMLVLVFLYLPRVQNVKTWGTRLIIAASFFIWAVNVDYLLFQFYLQEIARTMKWDGMAGLINLFSTQTAAQMTLAFWTFVAPLFQRPATQP